MENLLQNILVLDSNSEFLDKVESFLKSRYAVVKATSWKRGEEILKTVQVSAVLLDLKLPDMGGVEGIRWIHEVISPQLPVIVIADPQGLDSVVEAIRIGAHEFVLRTHGLGQVSGRVFRALEHVSLAVQVEALRRTQVERHDRLVFASEPMKRIFYQISNLALQEFDILVTGETGTGKDLLAFEIHQRGPRRDRPFIPVSIRALSETLIESELFGHEKGAFSGADKVMIGKLEAANGGTLYIPEVSTISEPLQLKLLQFMQYKTFSRVGQDARTPEIRLNLRIIMATNEDLEGLVKKGVMRPDFYHRIAVVKLKIPPLRERITDIDLLANYFLGKYAPGLGDKRYIFGEGVLEAFRNYAWPGNVRELENVIKNAIAYSLDGTLSLAEFPHLFGAQSEQDQCRICMSTRFPSMVKYREGMANFKQAYFLELLRRTDNNAARAASMAGLTPQGFRKIVKGLNLEVPLLSR